MSAHPPKKGFKWKGFVSLTLAMVFLFIVVSGVLLYLSPRGRVANWSGWTLLGLTKEEWSGLHLAAAVTIVVIAALHLFFNWKVLWHYIRTRTGFNLKFELAVALLLSGYVAVAGIWSLPPVDTLQQWNRAIKDYWEEEEPPAPIPHAEELTLSELAAELEISLEEGRARLESKGYELPEEDLKVAEIAAQNSVSPQALSDAMRPQAAGRGGAGRGGAGSGDAGHGGAAGGGNVRGLGRITLGDFCEQAGMSYERVAAFLDEMGASPTEGARFRDLAEGQGLTPFELKDLLTGEIK